MTLRETYAPRAGRAKTAKPEAPSALIQLLVQDGRVRLADPVSDYVPGVPDGAHIDAKATAMALLPTVLNQVYSGVSYPTVTDHDDQGNPGNR